MRMTGTRAHSPHARALGPERRRRADEKLELHTLPDFRGLCPVPDACPGAGLVQH